MYILKSPKTFSKLCVIFILIACLWFLSIKSKNLAQFEKQFPVKTNQLLDENGFIPVVLRCEDAELSAPNAIEQLSCVIQNNTNKYINAGTLLTSIAFEKDGKPYLDSNYLSFDTFVHPDFRDEHQNNLIPPGGQYRLSDLPTSFDNSIVIKGITVQIDYIEFADNTESGSNKAGSRIIGDIRKGAAKYKDWLTQKYNQSGRSINAIAPLLDKEQTLPKELGIQNGDEQQGAVIYRNYARKTYEAKGAEQLIKYLSRTNGSANK